MDGRGGDNETLRSSGQVREGACWEKTIKDEGRGRQPHDTSAKTEEEESRTKPEVCCH